MKKYKVLKPTQLSYLTTTTNKTSPLSGVRQSPKDIEKLKKIAKIREAMIRIKQVTKLSELYEDLIMIGEDIYGH